MIDFFLSLMIQSGQASDQGLSVCFLFQLTAFLLQGMIIKKIVFCLENSPRLEISQNFLT